MTPLLLLLWCSVAVGGGIFASGIRRHPPRQLFSALNAHTELHRPNPLRGVVPVFLLALLIAVLSQPLALGLASVWPISPDFAVRTGAWGRGLALGVAGVWMGVFLPVDEEGEKGARVARHAPVLLSLPLAMIVARGATSDALLGMGLGWALASCGLWRRYQEAAPAVLLPPAVFAVLSALAVAAAAIREQTPGTAAGFGWSFTALGVVLATMLLWTVREKDWGLNVGRGALAALVGGAVLAAAIFLGLGSGTAARNAALLVPLGVAVAILLWVLDPEDAGSAGGNMIPPLGVAALIAAALVAHLLLQGVGVALCLLFIVATAGWVPSREGDGVARWWTLMGIGAGIMQFRFLSIQAEVSWPDSGWGDFYVLLGLLAAGCAVTWSAQRIARETTMAAEQWGSLFLVLFIPAAAVILFGARPVPALLLGGLAAIIFSHHKSALAIVLCNFVMGLFLLQWLEVWLVLADMPRMVRIALLAGGFGAFSLISVLHWAWARQQSRGRAPDGLSLLSGGRL